jgi:hypothetical protein
MRREAIIVSVLLVVLIVAVWGYNMGVKRVISFSSGWTRPHGDIHKMTMAVVNPDLTAEFLIKYLGCHELEVPDPALRARGIRWVRVASPEPGFIPGEIHLVPAGVDRDIDARGGLDTNNDGIVSGVEMQDVNFSTINQWIKSVDNNMKSWTVYMNTHCGWYVDDLTPIVLKLQKHGIPFFGPTRRADGVVQLYVRVPSYHYVEIDSVVYDSDRTGITPIPWSVASKK